ncbi:MAG: TIGR00341 family protein [Magnetococcales bacterium]|nr:TIGR00341 family protein [Magnetococcales bacterium]
MNTPANPWFLVHDGRLDAENLESIFNGVTLKHIDDPASQFPPENSQVFLHLGDEGIKLILPMAQQKNWEIAPLPHPNNPWTKNRFGLDKEIRISRNHAFETEATSVRLMTCNGLPVFSSVVVGEALTLDNQDEASSRWSVFKGLVDGINKLIPVRFTVTTAKEQKFITAGIGLIALTGPGHPFLGRNLEALVTQDKSRFSVLALAPRSGLEYLSLLIRIIFVRSLRLRKLPTSVGLISSGRIVVDAGKELEYMVDGLPMTDKKLEMKLSDTPLMVRPGPYFPKQDSTYISPDKDVVRVAHLPSGESAQILSNAKRLPFFNHATEEEFRDLFHSLKEAAVFSRSFLTLMILSALLGVFGLFANSAPVLIGAMILAPLMAPIISLSMGLTRSQTSLILESMKTLALGIGTALFCAMVAASLLPLRALTEEMLIRLSPNLLDLGIAVVSGIAGAYANAKEDVAKSLAGVAIAVALVPPLCVAGIGLGWLDWSVVRGGSLLFATNLVGITVAASLTFLVLGFAPFRLARTGLVLSLSLLVAVSIPLFFAFDELIEKNRIMDEITRNQFLVHGHPIQITPHSVHLGAETLLRLQAISGEPVTSQDIESIHATLETLLNRPIAIEMSILLRR